VEIHSWKHDLKILKQYTETVGHPKELLSNILLVVEDFGKMKLRNGEHTLISQFKLFKEFFSLIRNIFFIKCAPEYVHSTYGRLDSLSDEIVNTLRYRKNSTYPNLLIDFSAITLLVQFLFHIIPGPGDGAEGVKRTNNVTSPVSWQEKHRLVYVLSMMTLSNAYGNLITCPKCKERVMLHVRDSKGPRCGRCSKSPGYFFTIGSKGKTVCHDINLYCKGCCNSLGMCTHCHKFIVQGKCACPI